MRIRLDSALVKRGLASSRSEASRLVADGVVTVGGSFADKPSRLVAAGENIEVLRQNRFVSRGGEKLDAALAHFGIDVRGCSALDVGASTGGFTECLLQHGVQRVVALDVGRHQLHERLVADDRVHVVDGVNVRHFSREQLPYPCSLIVVDVSFISLTRIIDRLVDCLSTTATPKPADRMGRTSNRIIALVKPQFEAGRRAVSKGKGVITDPVVHQETIEAVATAFEKSGCHVDGVMESPLKGASGNTEFLMLVDVPSRP